MSDDDVIQMEEMEGAVRDLAQVPMLPSCVMALENPAGGTAETAVLGGNILNGTIVERTDGPRMIALILGRVGIDDDDNIAIAIPMPADHVRTFVAQLLATVNEIDPAGVQ